MGVTSGLPLTFVKTFDLGAFSYSPVRSFTKHSSSIQI
ncbi:hypothetical protein UF75_2354 [Desulfosporosinus sp. I2]|nr:hypothetical protein UF75_2354 [Desulfosporosinus sp. I2]